jgi:hypothetical protein
MRHRAEAITAEHGPARPRGWAPWARISAFSGKEAPDSGGRPSSPRRPRGVMREPFRQPRFGRWFGRSDGGSRRRACRKRNER